MFDEGTSVSPEPTADLAPPVKTLDQDEAKLQRQLELEEQSIEMGVAQYQRRLTEAQQKGTLTDMPSGFRLLHIALQPMTQAVEEFLIPKRGGGHLGNVRGQIKDLPPVELAYLTVKTVVDEIVLEQPASAVAFRVGRAVLDLIEYKKFQAQNPGFLHAIERSLHTDNAGHRRKVLMLKKRQAGIADEPWDKTTMFHVGWKLLCMVIESTGIVERVVGGEKKYGRLKPSPEVLSFFNDTNARCGLLSPVYMPMVVPPVRWDGLYGGGFLNAHKTSRHRLIRTANKAVLESQGDMPLVHRTLNALQETPWRINRRVFDVVNELWETSTGMGVLPNPENEPMPPCPWDSDNAYKLLKKTDPRAVKHWKMQAAATHQHNVSLRSKRFALRFKLCIAEKFLDEGEVYFCWNLDWRGRLYPIQGLLHPQSDDLGKALLEFAEGKALGERGVYWLAVHGANCYGQGKTSFEDRIKWVHENEAAILDSPQISLDEPTLLDKRI